MPGAGALAGAAAGNIKPKTYTPNVVQGLGDYLATITRGGAGAQANAVSFAAQANQGAFNQASANNANMIGDYRVADQMGYNSAMWQQAADWNEMMFNRSMAFNAEEAQKNRDFQKEMDSTKYQRAIKDMETAGLNPIMAVTGGGISVGGGTGSTASVGAPQMSSASSGLINGIAASEGNFTGQMDYLSGILGLIGGAIAGASSAFKNLGILSAMDGGLGKGLTIEIGKTIRDLTEPKNIWKDQFEVKPGSIADNVGKFFGNMFNSGSKGSGKSR